MALRSHTIVCNNNARRFARLSPALVVNVLLFVAVIVLAVGIFVAYRIGAARALRDEHVAMLESPPSSPIESPPQQSDVEPVESWRARELDDDRHRLFRALADARDEAARYRQLVVDIENNAPPPLLDSPGTPDDLKLIVGIGPVLERMLQQLGISTYRQIARWTERDIDEFNARLPEFPGRIRRDAWVTQARELHHSKYG